MTRINTIDPTLLTDQHLMAEYREFPMVMSSLERSLKAKRGFDLSRIPKDYTLNTGHVMYFYDKGKFMRKRWDLLISELKDRGFSIDPDARVVKWHVYDNNPHLNNDWQPSLRDHMINLDRINLRISQKRDWYKFHGVAIKEDFEIKVIEHYNINSTQGRPSSLQQN